MKGKRHFLSTNTDVTELLPIQCTTYMLPVHQCVCADTMKSGILPELIKQLKTSFQ